MIENLPTCAKLSTAVNIVLVLLSLHRIACEEENTSDALPHAATKEYKGYSVYRYVPRNDEQLELLRLIEKEFSTYTSPFDVQFWKESCCVGGQFDIMLNRKASSTVLQQLEESGMDGELLMPDVNGVIREQSNWTEASIIEGRAGEDYFIIYRQLDEIYRYMDVLKSLSPQNTITESGKSFEGRPLRVLKIGNSPSKSIIWLDAGTHAREWIGPATAMYIAARLATTHASCTTGGECSDSERDLFNRYTFWVQPVVNPDGYVYSHESDRLWRKTRSTSRGSPWAIFCTGTDPNRNYDAGWSGEGSSGNPCSQTFAGRSAHSEPEVKALTELILKERRRIAFFLTLHSYSQIMLLPYGFSKQIPPEYPALEQLAMIGAEAIKMQGGTDYKIGSAARILYVASGTASDWAFEKAGVKYSYTFELPDTGEYGFLLPAERIKPVGEETFLAFTEMIKNLP